MKLFLWVVFLGIFLNLAFFVEDVRAPFIEPDTSVRLKPNRWPKPQSEPYTTFSIGYSNLLQNRRLLSEGDPLLKQALNELTAIADIALQQPFRSVTQKLRVDGIDDIHSYVSMGPYWWPDTTRDGNLPYIRKDGVTNPEVKKITDKAYFNEFSDVIEKLSLAYFFTNNEKYAKNGIERIRVWFINDDTYMRPHLNHGQYIPGRSSGRAEGVIDMRALIPVIDGIQLLRTSKEWTPHDEKAINEWVAEFLYWLENSKIGLQAAKLENNIGTAYYMQVISLNMFLNNKDAVVRYCKNQLPQLLDRQFDRSGRQPFELKRTNSWSYSLLNLQYWFNIANMVELIEIDLWNYITPRGGSLKKAFEFLMPFATDQKRWERTQLRTVNYTNSFETLYQMSKGKFKNGLFKVPKKYKVYEEIGRSPEKIQRLIWKN